MQGFAVTSSAASVALCRPPGLLIFAQESTFTDTPAARLEAEMICRSWRRCP